MPNISKANFIIAVECPTKGWYAFRGIDRPAVTIAEQFRFRQGMQIGKLARDMFPEGKIISERNTDQAVADTAHLLQDPSVSVIFEGAFKYRTFVARVDILQRSANGWILCEVKSGKYAEGKIDSNYVMDVAYSTAVAVSAGLPVQESRLVLLSSDYRLGQPINSLFVETSGLGEVEHLANEYRELFDRVETLLHQDHIPPPRLNYACRECSYFKNLCIGETNPEPIFTIPRIGKANFEKLVTMGIDRVSQVPEDFKLSEIQKRVVISAKSGIEWIGSNLKNDLLQFQWPVHYLDFETMSTAIPLYPDIGPYDQVPTQYSMHILDHPGGKLEHKEFLADQRIDPRRGFIESLLADLGDSGSIAIYSSYERTILKKLGAYFSDLETEIAAVIDRLLDLEKILREGYYHPEFLGRTSIKLTLPILVPGFSYDHLAVNNGDSATALFAEMAMGDHSEAECSEIRSQLLEYCGQDTMAMVKIHERLIELAKKGADK